MTGKTENGNHEIEEITGAVIYAIAEGKRMYLLMRTDTAYRFPQRRAWPEEDLRGAAGKAVFESASIAEIDWVDPSRFCSICQYAGWDRFYHRETMHLATLILGKLGNAQVPVAPRGEATSWVEFSEARVLLAASPLLETLLQADEVVRQLEGL